MVPFRDNIDLGEDGTHLIGTDDEGVSYFAEVKDGEVTHLFCTDKSGARLPSFTLAGHVKSENVCYLCWVNADGWSKVFLHANTVPIYVVLRSSDIAVCIGKMGSK